MAVVVGSSASDRAFRTDGARASGYYAEYDAPEQQPGYSGNKKLSPQPGQAGRQPPVPAAHCVNY